MAFPVVPVLGALALGYGAKVVYDKYVAKPRALTPGPVSELLPGKTYALQVTTKFPPTQLALFSQGSAQGPVKAGGDLVKTTLDLLGFVTLSQPMPRDADNEARILSGEAGDWIVNAKWTKADPRPDLSAVKTWILGIKYYLLPVA